MEDYNFIVSRDEFVMIRQFLAQTRDLLAQLTPICRGLEPPDPSLLDSLAVLQVEASSRIVDLQLALALRWGHRGAPSSSDRPCDVPVQRANIAGDPPGASKRPPAISGMWPQQQWRRK